MQSNPDLAEAPQPGAAIQTDAPALAVIRDVLTSVDGEAARRWRTAADGPSVTVNGVSVPILRVRGLALNGFFRELGPAAGRRLFGGELPPCRVNWNKRFRRLGGRIIPSERLIELSAPHYEACGIVALGLVYVHELIHWSLYTDHLPFGHSGEFKRRSLAIGMPDIRHEMPLPERLRKPVRRHVYVCPNGHEVVSGTLFRAPRCCLACCRQFNGGRADRRFVLRFVRSEFVAASLGTETDG